MIFDIEDVIKGVDTVGIRLPAGTIFYKNVRVEVKDSVANSVRKRAPSRAVLECMSEGVGILPLSSNEDFKVRFSSARVLRVYYYLGIKNNILKSKFDHNNYRFYSPTWHSRLEYRIYGTVVPDSYNDSVSSVCTNGIHGFLSPSPAVMYA